MNNREIIAYFVGGPENGATRVLETDRTEWLTITQPIIRAISKLAEESPMATLNRIKANRYVKTKELSNPYLRGCYIFEWMGEV